MATQAAGLLDKITEATNARIPWKRKADQGGGVGSQPKPRQWTGANGKAHMQGHETGQFILRLENKEHTFESAAEVKAFCRWLQEATADRP